MSIRHYEKAFLSKYSSNMCRKIVMKSDQNWFWSRVSFITWKFCKFILHQWDPHIREEWINLTNSLHRDLHCATRWPVSDTRVYGVDNDADHYVKVDGVDVTRTQGYDPDWKQSASTSIVLHLGAGQGVAVDPNFTGTIQGGPATMYTSFGATLLHADQQWKTPVLEDFPYIHAPSHGGQVWRAMENPPNPGTILLK